MPAIPSPLPLLVDDLPRVDHYLGDSGHRNHRGYRVQPPVGHGVAHGAAFVAAVTNAMEIINGPRTGKERVRVAAYWYVLTFAEGSFLTTEEWVSYEEMALKVLGSRRPFLTSRHENKTNGEADLNIIDPEIRLHPIPQLDRPRTINRLLRLRHASDRWVVEANQARQIIGKDPIPAIDPIADTACTGLARLVRVIAKSLPAGADTFSRQQIPSALKSAGFHDTDWALSIAGKLSIHRWPETPAKKTKPRTFSIAVKDVVAWIWLYLLRRQGKTKEGKREKITSLTGKEVMQNLRTEPEVIRPNHEAEIQEHSL